MSQSSPPKQSALVLVVRYGVGGALVIAGIVLLIVNPGGFGIEGFGMAVGGGAAVLLLNFLFRIGVSGDLERQREEEARHYYDVYGRWPDE